jgi:hypothetical protein
MSDDWIKRFTDPDGREVVFDAGSHMHLVRRGRGWLIDEIDSVLGTIERPDHREEDPMVGRERFYRQDFPLPGQWLRVVVDFSERPAWVVTALQQNNDPRHRQ